MNYYKPMKMRYSMLAAVMVITGCGSLPQSDPGESDVAIKDEAAGFEILRERHDLPVTAELISLHVDNPHGNIYLRKSGEPYVGVFTTEQRLGDAPRAADISILNDPASVTVTISYPNDHPGDAHLMDDKKPAGRVDLVIFVPPGVDTHLATTHGDISVKRLDNNIIASSLSGQISVTARGTLTLISQQGDIYGSAMNADWGGESKVRTSSGNIVFGVPQYGDVTLSAKSGHSIESDFKSTVSTGPNGSELTRVIGDGSNRIHFESINGGIKLDGFDRNQVEPAQPGENNVSL